MPKVPEDLKKEISSVLLSKVGGVNLHKFQEDFKGLIGHKINPGEYGFKNLLELLKSIPDTVRLSEGDDPRNPKLIGVVGDTFDYIPPTAKKAQALANAAIANTEGMAVDQRKIIEWEAALKPNMKQLWAIMFSRSPQTSREQVDEEFSKAGPVAEVSLTARYVFVRYHSKKEALTALKMFASKYDLRVPEEKMDPRHVIKGSDKDREGRMSRPPNKAKNSESIMRRENKEGTLYIGNIPDSMEKEDIEELFTKRGFNISESRLKSKDDGRRFGFVELPTAEEAQQAAQMLHKVEIDGRKLVIRVTYDSSQDFKDGVTQAEATSFFESLMNKGVEAVPRMTPLDDDDDRPGSSPMPSLDSSPGRGEARANGQASQLSGLERSIRQQSVRERPPTVGGEIKPESKPHPDPGGAGEGARSAVSWSTSGPLRWMKDPRAKGQELCAVEGILAAVGNSISVPLTCTVPHRQQQSSPDDTYVQIFVRNLPQDISKEEVKKAFESFEIYDMKMQLHGPLMNTKVPNIFKAEEAIEAMNLTKLKNNTIYVNISLKYIHHFGTVLVNVSPLGQRSVVLFTDKPKEAEAKARLKDKEPLKFTIKAEERGQGGKYNHIVSRFLEDSDWESETSSIHEVPSGVRNTPPRPQGVPSLELRQEASPPKVEVQVPISTVTGSTAASSPRCELLVSDHPMIVKETFCTMLDDCLPMTTPVLAEHLLTNTEVLCVLLDESDPSLVWGQICDNQTDLQKLRSIMVRISDESHHQQYNPVVHSEMTKFVANYHGEYYRVWLIKRLPGDQAEIFYVDYGNVEVVPLSELRVVDEDVWEMLYPMIVPFRINSLNGHSYHDLDSQKILAEVLKRSSTSTIPEHIIDINVIKIINLR